MSILEKIATQTVMPDYYKTLSTVEMESRINQIKQRLQHKLYIPGHHYQRDEVIQFADDTGDSLKLAQLSASNNSAEFIVFCGVHFMAETADILTNDNQIVLLPDLNAGCSMADMADIYETERAWECLIDTFGDTFLPLTYVNSTAAIKAFCGIHGGATVTSSNAKEMVQWALTKKERIFFLPDQHLGRNTAFDLGVPLEQMAVWDPIEEKLQFTGDPSTIKIVLWKGHCSVHEKFTVENIIEMRNNILDIQIIVHPECSHEVVSLSDFKGSTNYIIDVIKSAAPNTSWAIGTEMNLVKRLAKMFPNKNIYSLNPNMCPCLTMNRIDLPHLLWCLESIENGNPINRITVDKETALHARVAVQTMLEKV